MDLCEVLWVLFYGDLVDVDLVIAMVFMGFCVEWVLVEGCCGIVWVVIVWYFGIIFGEVLKGFLACF